MVYRILADIIVLIHFGFILFVIFGGFLCLKWRWLLFVHLPAAVWGALVELQGWYCPLTPLEERLRLAAGTVVTRTSFIEHHLTPLIYPHWLTREWQIVLGAGVVAINLAVYAFLFFTLSRRRNTLL